MRNILVIRSPIFLTLFLLADTNDFQFIWEKTSALSKHWDSIGIMLGLSSNKLDEIEAKSKTVRACLRKVFDCWLKRDYDYKSCGVPTLRMLCNCIKSKSGGADPALADEITKEYSVSPLRASSEEVQLKLSSSPVDTLSSKGIIKHYITMLYLLLQKLLPMLRPYIYALNLKPKSFMSGRNLSNMMYLII